MSDNRPPRELLSPGLALTLAEVEKHRTAGDCWTIFQGRVYDVTTYMDFHPGGKKELMKGGGRDMTELFQKAHPWVSCDGLIGKLCLGPLVAGGAPPPDPEAEAEVEDAT